MRALRLRCMQTEQVIGMVQLMREYLDAEQAEPGAFSTALSGDSRLVEDYRRLRRCAMWSATGGHLRGYAARTGGAVAAGLAVFDYDVIEAQPAGGRVKVVLTKEPAGTWCAVRAGGILFYERGAIDIPATSASTLDR